MHPSYSTFRSTGIMLIGVQMDYTSSRLSHCSTVIAHKAVNQIDKLYVETVVNNFLDPFLPFLCVRP